MHIIPTSSIHYLRITPSILVTCSVRYVLLISSQHQFTLKTCISYVTRTVLIRIVSIPLSFSPRMKYFFHGDKTFNFGMMNIGIANVLTYYQLEDAPPPRICYQLIHRHPKTHQLSVIHIFEKELREFIQQTPSLNAIDS